MTKDEKIVQWVKAIALGLVLLALLILNQTCLDILKVLNKILFEL